MARNFKLINSGFWFGVMGIMVGVFIGGMFWGPKDFKNETGALLLRQGTCVLEMDTNFEVNARWCSDTWNLVQELDK